MRQSQAVSNSARKYGSLFECRASQFRVGNAKIKSTWDFQSSRFFPYKFYKRTWDNKTKKEFEFVKFEGENDLPIYIHAFFMLL